MNFLNKTLAVASLCLALLPATLLADDEKPIHIAQLPQEAQMMIKKNFSDLKIASVQMEKEDGGKTYEVKFENGASIEFNKNGKWREIDFEKRAVPAKFIPKPIQHHVAKKWPKEHIVKIEKDKRNYEIELSSDIEIKYDRNFKVIDIDR